MRNRLFTTACLAATTISVSGCGGSSATKPETLTFTTGVDRLYSSGQTQRLSVDGATSITEIADGWIVTVDGKTVELHSSDLGAHPDLGERTYYKELDGNETVVFWPIEGNRLNEFEYLNVFGFGHADGVPGADSTTLEPSDYTRSSWVYIVHGTPTNDMPIDGTATYDGRVIAREWRRDQATFSGQSTLYSGDFDMTANFGTTTTVTGALNFTAEQHLAIPDQPPILITDGTIPFTATVTDNRFSVSGMNIDAGRFNGYEIAINSGFFGPTAAEVGGILEGETANTLMHGYFAGKQQ